MNQSNENLPITDWSLDGRKAYIEKNRLQVELTIETAAEELSDTEISCVFGSMDRLPDEIIKRFLVRDLNPDKLPCQDLSLFSQMKFWIQHKTGGKVTVGRGTSCLPNEIHENVVAPSLDASLVSKVSNTLQRFNQLVDADLVGYWLQAHKKLRAELSGDLQRVNLDPPQNNHSSPQKTRYKSDASFRFAYLYLGIEAWQVLQNHSYQAAFQARYFSKSQNKPQYVAPTKPEEHALKHGIRSYIARVIQEIATQQDNLELLDLALIKPAIKKALLDQYEFDRGMKESSWCYLEQLKKLGVSV